MLIYNIIQNKAKIKKYYKKFGVSIARSIHQSSISDRVNCAENKFFTGIGCHKVYFGQLIAVSAKSAGRL